MLNIFKVTKTHLKYLRFRIWTSKSCFVYNTDLKSIFIYLPDDPDTMMKLIKNKVILSKNARIDRFTGRLDINDIPIFEGDRLEKDWYDDDNKRSKIGGYYSSAKILFKDNKFIAYSDDEEIPLEDFKVEDYKVVIPFKKEKK